MVGGVKAACRGPVVGGGRRLVVDGIAICGKELILEENIRFCCSGFLRAILFCVPIIRISSLTVVTVIELATNCLPI